MLRLVSFWASLAMTALWLTGCAYVVHQADRNIPLPEVEGPIPQLEAAPAATSSTTVLRMERPWTFHNRPNELFGVPVVKVEPETNWTVTGQWRADSVLLSGEQPWVLLGNIYNWYRLDVDMEPWGRVHMWTQVPPEWVHGHEPVPFVNPRHDPILSPQPVPYSHGHVLKWKGVPHSLRSCPQLDCPVLERPVQDDLVPVTGVLTDAEGEQWHRVEYRQQILWTPASPTAFSFAGHRRRHGDEAAGFRSCEPVVMFQPPPHTLCPVERSGLFMDDFERLFDWLDPIHGRLPLTWSVESADPQDGDPGEPVVFVWGDQSEQWEWSVERSDACHASWQVFQDAWPSSMDAVRVSITLQDADMPGLHPDGDFATFAMAVEPQGVEWDSDVLFSLWPDWEGRVPSGFALAKSVCRSRPTFACDVTPVWGHTGTDEALHNINSALSLATAQALYALMHQAAGTGMGGDLPAGAGNLCLRLQTGDVGTNAGHVGPDGNPVEAAHCPRGAAHPNDTCGNDGNVRYIIDWDGDVEDQQGRITGLAFGDRGCGMEGSPGHFVYQGDMVYLLPPAAIGTDAELDAACAASAN